MHLLLSLDFVIFPPPTVCPDIKCSNNGTLDTDTCTCYCSHGYTRVFCDTGRFSRLLIIDGQFLNYMVFFISRIYKIAMLMYFYASNTFRLVYLLTLYPSSLTLIDTFGCHFNLLQLSIINHSAFYIAISVFMYSDNF